MVFEKQRPQQERQRLRDHAKRKAFERSRNTDHGKHGSTLRRRVRVKLVIVSRNENCTKEKWNTHIVLTWKGRVATGKGKVMNKEKCVAHTSLESDAESGKERPLPDGAAAIATSFATSGTPADVDIGELSDLTTCLLPTGQKNEFSVLLSALGETETTPHVNDGLTCHLELRWTFALVTISTTSRTW